MFKSPGNGHVLTFNSAKLLGTSVKTAVAGSHRWVTRSVDCFEQESNVTVQDFSCPGEPCALVVENRKQVFQLFWKNLRLKLTFHCRFRGTVPLPASARDDIYPFTGPAPGLWGKHSSHLQTRLRTAQSKDSCCLQLCKWPECSHLSRKDRPQCWFHQRNQPERWAGTL